MVDRTQRELEALARYEDIECVSQDLGEWPVADTGPVAGYYFICDTGSSPTRVTSVSGPRGSGGSYQ